LLRKAKQWGLIKGVLFMKVTTKKSKENKVTLDIEVPQDAVLKRFDEVYEKIGQEAKVPGYRPGKAPRSVLEQHHAQLARQEVLKTLISDTYQESIKEENIDVIDMPEISEVKLEGNVLFYKAEVEIKPEIKIKQYKGLKLKKAELKVEPSEIHEYLKQLKKARGEEITDIKLANALGYKTQEEFMGCLEKQFYLKKENEERARLEKELIGQLLKNTSFQVPASLVEKRIHELEHQAEHQLAEYGLPQEKIKQRLEEFKPKFKTEAEEQVKVFLILEEIAKFENIKKDDHMINKTVEFLFMEADWN
jgi:FKBP-type peptidyl-prolyl cis-trans isomerase (trigger factor)